MRIHPITDDRTALVGVVNATPDSFSDGGLFLRQQAAIEHGLRLHDAGADLIDVGGESTRPGANPVDTRAEQGRVLGVIAGLSARQVPVSIDTRWSNTAKVALEAGAAVVNDVSGGCPYVLRQGVTVRLFKNIGSGSDGRDDLSGNWLPD
jgi:dihydropteroate synthase